MDFQEIKQINIPRFNSGKEWQLLCLSNDSTEAYGIAIYLRWTPDEIVNTNLIFSKSSICESNKTSLQIFEIIAVLIIITRLNFMKKNVYE